MVNLNKEKSDRRNIDYKIKFVTATIPKDMFLAINLQSKSYIKAIFPFHF